MNILKIVLGVILGLASLKVIIQMAQTESGAGLGGALIGFVIMGGLSAWLIYSGLNSKK